MGALSRGVDHPDADDVGVAGGPGDRGGEAGVARRGDDDEAVGARPGEEAGRDGVLRVAEAGTDAFVGEAQVEDLEAEGFAAIERPLDGREDVGGERGGAAVAVSEDSEGDDGGPRGDPLVSGGDAGDGGAVPVAVLGPVVAVGEVPSGEDPPGIRRARAEVGMEVVDSGVDDPDGAPGSGQPGREEAVGADLGRPDLSRGAHDAVEDDRPRRGLPAEPLQPGRVQPASEDPAAVERPQDLQTLRDRRAGGRLASHEDADSPLGRDPLRDPLADVELRRPGHCREGGRSEGHGREERAEGADGLHF